MSYSVLTNRYRPTNQRSSRNGAQIDTLIWHHQASTNANQVAQAMISGSKLVSANYIVTNEGEIWNLVDEEDRAWTSGSRKDGGRGAAWDRRGLTTEIENETLGPEWRISDAALDACARLSADFYRRHRIVNELGHRDLWTLFNASYPTYCPGPETKNRIVELRSGVSLPPVSPPVSTPTIPKPPVPIDIGWHWELPSKAVQQAIQWELHKRGRYNGLIDGDWGRLSIAAIQLTCTNVGYDGLRDGIPGKLTCHFVQVYAQRFGDYAGGVDDKLGPNSWAGFLLGLQRP